MPPLKITVATVTYNAESLIRRTIQSVEEQTYAHVEHIVIDGNSQDGTLELIHHYQERNSVAEIPHEIVCLSEPDNGLYDAMNKALDLATGDYILFLNAGDTLHSAATLAQIAAVASQGGQRAAVVYGHTDIVDAQGAFIRHRRLEPPERLTWKSFKSGMVVCHQAFFARADLAKRFRYDPRYRFSADFDWCVRIMKAAAKEKSRLANSHLVIADYLSEGATTRNHSASLRERFAIMARHYGLLPTVVRHAWFVVRKFLKK